MARSLALTQHRVYIPVPGDLVRVLLSNAMLASWPSGTEYGKVLRRSDHTVVAASTCGTRRPRIVREITTFPATDCIVSRWLESPWQGPVSVQEQFGIQPVAGGAMLSVDARFYLEQPLLQRLLTMHSDLPLLGGPGFTTFRAQLEDGVISFLDACAESAQVLIETGRGVLPAGERSAGERSERMEAALARATLRRAEALVAGMAQVVEARHPAAAGHGARVACTAAALAAVAGLPATVGAIVARAALLHDVGAIGLPAELVRRRIGFTREDVVLLMEHATLGSEILKSVPSLRPLVPAVLHHHERYDGRGYPNGLAGDAIPIEAHVLQIADAYDEMVRGMAGAVALTPEQALAELARNEGPKWNPQLVQAFCRLLRIRSRYAPTQHTLPML